MKKNGQVGLAIFVGVMVVMAIGVFWVVSKNGGTDNFIQLRFYDSNGDLISNDALSVVVPMASYMDVTVTVTNTGNTPLSCIPVYAYPDSFNLAFAKQEKTVPSTELKKAAWTSGLIPMSALNATQIINVTMECWYNSGQTVNYLANKTGSIELVIQKACGNDYCETGETANNCPQDCFFGGQVQFRTSNLLYPKSGLHGVAYRNSCSNNLIKYDYMATVCTSSTSSACPARPGMVLMLNNTQLPGKPVWASGGGCLYMNNSNPLFDINIYWKVATSSGSPCPTVNTWGGYAYHKNDASTWVNSTPTLVDPAAEVMC